MNALALGLRSLDPQTFESLVTALLKARYPGVDIKHVNGQSGDKGLDVITGYLDEHPTIWQCKSFANGTSASQKQQIKESLNRALEHHKPRRWVLCLSTDLDAKALRWWQQLTKSHINRTELQLWQATDIIQQLLYHDAIREQFFPLITMNVPVIRETLAGTNLLSIEDLSALTEQNTSAYLARLEQMDARFSYALTHSRNQEPNVSAGPDTLLTVTTGHTTLSVGARDQEALRASPPQVHFTLKGEGVEKFLEHQRTGKPVAFTSDELVSFKSDFEFLMPEERAAVSLQFSPPSAQPTFALRVIFGKGAASLVYEYILFRRISAGTEEGTLESSTPLPFPITLVLRKDRTGNVCFEDKCSGHSVQEAHRMAKAIKAAIVGGEVNFYDLSSGAPFFSAAIKSDIPEWLQQYEQFLGDATAVANDYNVTLIIPESITNDDHRALMKLRRLHDGLVTSVGPFTLTLDKSAQPQQVGPTDTTEIDFKVEIPEFPEELVVFGKRILTGPVEYRVPKARVCEEDAYREFLLSAPIGSSITINLEPIGDITIQRQSK